MNNVDSDHEDHVIIHLRCLCDFSLLRYKEDPSAASSFCRYAAIFVDRINVCTSLGLFILGFFMGYGDIASDRGASICERSVLSFDI